MKKSHIQQGKSKIATTKYISEQREYVLPGNVFNPILLVEVYNRKKNSWSKVPFNLAIILGKKKLKTDEEIKIHINKLIK